MLLYLTIKDMQASFSNKEEEKHLRNLKVSIHELGAKQAGGLDEISQWWIDSILQQRKIAQLR